MAKASSIITRKIELIPDIEGMTQKESNDRCYGLIRGYDSNLYKVANLLVSQLYGVESLFQMLCLQNYENLVMIVSKAFGGSDDGNTRPTPTKKSGNFGDLKAFVADANNF